jgi:outer membrane protein assembly factor BamB
VPIAELLVDDASGAAHGRRMKTLDSRIFACLALMVAASPAAAQNSVEFKDIAGWWAADPAWGGESSHLAMQFLERDGKQVAHLSIVAIGGYDISLGEVVIAGNAVDMKGLSFPLTWNPATKTLSGKIPAEAAPVYDIPIEFKRGEPLAKPPPKDWKAPRPKVVWSVETGGAPVWAGIERDSATGLLFVGNEAGTLSAITRDGKLRWKFETGKPIRGQPRVLGKDVYVASDSGYLYKVRRDTGVEAWRARIDTGAPTRIPPNQPDTRWDRYGSSIASHGKQLYYASRDKNLYALDLQTGRELWRVQAGDLMTATPTLYKESLIFAAFDGKVQAVAARDGKPIWTYDAKLAVPGDLVVSADRVLVGSRSYDLIALDAVTGKELWKRYYWFSWIESPPVVRDGVVYTGSSDATNVYAINLEDGSFKWKTPVPGWSWQRPAVTQDLVITGTAGAGAFPASRNGSLVALDRASGAIEWIYLDPPSEEIVKAKKGWGFGASPVVADGVVYAADLNGRVYAIELHGLRKPLARAAAAP